MRFIVWKAWKTEVFQNEHKAQRLSAKFSMVLGGVSRRTQPSLLLRHSLPLPVVVALIDALVAVFNLKNI